MKYLVPLLTILLVAACSSRPTTSGIGVEQASQQYNQQLIVNNPELQERLSMFGAHTCFFKVDIEYRVFLDADDNIKIENIKHQMNIRGFTAA